MNVDKRFVIDAPQEKVWQFISAPEKVGLCFPGCQGVTALGDNKYQTAIKVQIGPIKTLFNVSFEETHIRPMEYFAYTSRGEEGNRASRLKAESSLTLTPVDADHTQVEYTSELSIVGRLGKFGLGMMKKKADAMGDEFIESLRAKIEGPPTTATALPATAEVSHSSTRQKIFAAVVVAGIIALIYYFATL